MGYIGIEWGIGGNLAIKHVWIMGIYADFIGI